MGVLYARVAGAWVPISSGGGSGVQAPGYVGPWRNAASTVDTNTSQYGSTLGGQRKEGLMLDASGFLRFYSQKGVPTGGSQIQFLEVNPDHLTETWIASLIKERFQLGDMTMGLHPYHGQYAMWKNSDQVGTQDNYIWMAYAGDLLLNANAGKKIDLNVNNTTYARVSVLTTELRSEQTQVASNISGQIAWNYAQLLFYPPGGYNFQRIALFSSGSCPQIRNNTGFGDLVELTTSSATANCPIVASAFTLSSSVKIKRDVRPLRERDHIVVNHDVGADLVPDLDIMSLRPVAYRPKEPAMKIVPIEGVEFDPQDETTWHYEPRDGILGHEGNRERLGLIAEEVQTVIPSAVNHADDGRVGGIDYAQITVALLDHVQRLTEEVATLRYRIAELEGTT